MRTLWHGTTRNRAEAIIQNGPDPQFREPNSTTDVEGFSAAPCFGPYAQGDPVIIAKGKASLFPDEGGPALVEFEFPRKLRNWQIS